LNGRARERNRGSGHGGARQPFLSEVHTGPHAGGDALLLAGLVEALALIVVELHRAETEGISSVPKACRGGLAPSAKYVICAILNSASDCVRGTEVLILFQGSIW
jgi:hypothetical protein